MKHHNRRIKKDFQYILLNCIVNRIPSWTIRKILYSVNGLKIGKMARIMMGTVVVNPKGISIGERVVINEGCHLDGRGGLVIENDTSISFGTIIISASHKMNSSGFDYYTNPVFIGNHVWIGAKAIILDGSTIEPYCVIGAGSVLKKCTDKGGVYIGNPAQKIKTRECGAKYKLNYTPYFR